MDTLMETLQKRTDKKLHSMMYHKITDLTEGVDIQQATLMLIQQFSKKMFVQRSLFKEVSYLQVGVVHQLISKEVE